MKIEDIDRAYAIKKRNEKLAEIALKLSGDLEDEVRESVRGRHIAESVQSCIDAGLEECELADLAATLLGWIGRLASDSKAELEKMLND